MQSNQAAKLYQLQTLDLSIAKQKVRLKEIEALLNEDEAVSKAKNRLSKAEETIKPLQARAHDLELESKSLAEKIQDSDEHLYSGKVTSVKELSELQEEGESLKRRAAALEQTQLDLLTQIEGDQTAIDALQGTLSELLESKSAANAELKQEWRAIRTEVNDTIEKRIAFATEIDPTYIKAYENLRQRMRGTPVARFVQDSCTICGVEQTSQLSQQVRQGRQICYCGNCGRILAAV